MQLDSRQRSDIWQLQPVLLTLLTLLVASRAPHGNRTVAPVPRTPVDERLTMASARRHQFAGEGPRPRPAPTRDRRLSDRSDEAGASHHAAPELTPVERQGAEYYRFTCGRTSTSKGSRLLAFLSGT